VRQHKAALYRKLMLLFSSIGLFTEVLALCDMFESSAVVDECTRCSQGRWLLVLSAEFRCCTRMARLY